jgi:zinc protease
MPGARLMDGLLLPRTEAQVLSFPNGLELVVLEDAAAPVASVQAWVRTGSIHEGPWLGAGLSHFLEHMLFKGTGTRGPQDFARGIQEKGGYINAYTSFDRTVYWVDIPATGVAVAVELLADAILDSSLPEAEFAKEQDVIRREFAMGNDDPDTVAGKQLFATAYTEHPFRHPVIGHRDLFDRLTRADMLAYYRTRYAPNNVFFTVVGDVKADAIRDQLAGIFAAQPRRPLPDVLIPREPDQMGLREQHTEFPTELARLGMAWHIPTTTHADIPALDLLSSVLGTGRSARFYRRLREGLAIVHGADAWCYTSSTAGLFGVDAVLDPGKLDQTTAEIRAMLAEVREQGVTPAELDKARRQFLSHHFHSLTTMRGKASSLGSNWLHARDLHFTDTYLAAIQRVTPDDLSRVARTHLHPENYTLTTLVPEGTARRRTTRASVRRQGGVEKFTLSNGLRLLVREDDRLPLVSMVATFRCGLLAETPADNGIARLFARTLIKGTPTRTAADIAESIESLGGALGSDSGNNSVSLSARVLRPDTAHGLSLMAEILLHASFPPAALERERDAQLASLKADAEEVTSVARNLLRARLFAGHPFALPVLGTPGSLASIKGDALTAFRTRHLTAANGVLSIFGAVDAREIRDLAEAALAILPAGTPSLAAIPQPVFPGADIEVEAVMPKEQAVLMLGYPGVDLFSPDIIPLELIDEACSDLGSRMFQRIREDMGLAYFVGSSHLTGLAPGAFSFYVGTDPAKVAEVKAALLDEIRKLAEEGITAPELERSKAKLLGAQAIRSQSNDSLAHGCALDELYGLGHRYYEGLRQRVAATTLEQVRDAARRYFTQPHVTAIVHP